MKAIAESYADSPENTLVVSPDNASRMEINRIIHGDLQAKGVISEEEHRQTVLTPRQDLTGADRQWAAQYAPGDVIRCTKGSRAIGVEGGEYAHVTGVDADQNLLTIQRGDGEHLTYDPRRLEGVNVYRESEREFSAGDRIQFTAPFKDEHVANRQLGTIHISTTAMRSPATAAKARRPTASWFMWTRRTHTSSSSTRVWST